MKTPGLEVGLLLHTRQLIREEEASSHVERLWDSAIHAEDLGFDHLWVGDSP
jgi:alkanesulfonate monooxygenase SsuD/methylene tetrahydromethanopterin reductase-like flavin-dependent oxidoreductase (luciferase family)